MKEYVLDFINDNEYKKLERALKKNNMVAYKKLNFEYYPSLKNGKFIGELVSQNKTDNIETYELKLPSDSMCIQKYGDVVLKYRVFKNENTVMLDTITPTEILFEEDRPQLTTYKGVTISKDNTSRDMFKIDLLNMLAEKTSDEIANKDNYSKDCENIKKLKELLDLNAITKEEFDKKKKEILDNM